jgi:hypothetical protein
VHTGDLGPYRWTLAEYVLRCQQGADIAEVVVEGEFDRDLIQDAMERWGATDVTVLDSDYVYVLDDEVLAAGATQGVKGRILAIAAALSSAHVDDPVQANVVVVVDRDYDATGGGDFSLLTDGYSMESYVSTPSVLERFVRVWLGRASLPRGAGRHAPRRRRTCSGAELYERAVAAGTSIAGVRMALRRLDDPVRLIDGWARYVTVSTDGAVVTRQESLLLSTLTAASRAEELSHVTPWLAEETERAVGDPFRLVRGHDFVCLLLKLLRSTWGRRVAGSRFAHVDEQALLRTLALSAEQADLDSQPLFRDLRLRFA